MVQGTHFSLPSGLKIDPDIAAYDTKMSLFKVMSEAT